VASLDALLRVAVEWEGFRSRWHIAAINPDSSVYRADAEQRFRASVKEGRFKTLEPYVNVALPARLSIEAVQSSSTHSVATSPLATSGLIEPRRNSRSRL
jgi:hypothetical protein